MDGNNPSPGTGYWEKIVSSSSGIITSSVNNQTTVTNIARESTIGLRWTVVSANNVCNDYTEISVTNNDFYLSAGVNDAGCYENYTLSGDNIAGGTGVWTVSSGSGTFVNDTQHDTNVNGLNQGANVYVWTVSKNSCTNQAQVTITNNNPDDASITSPIVINRTICASNVNLIANNPLHGGIGQWTVTDGAGLFSNATNFQTSVSGVNPGLNTYTWTISKTGCTTSANIEITNNMVVSEAGPAQHICTDTTTINATNPLLMYPNQGVGYWSNAGSGTAIIANTASNVTTVSGLLPNTNKFRWTVRKGDCVAFDDVEIISDKITASAIDLHTCNDHVNLSGNIPAPGEWGVWSSYTASAVYVNQSLYDTRVDGLVEGDNSFSWKIENGFCADSASITVRYTNPLAQAGAEQDLCRNFTFLSANDPTPGTGEWSIATGSATFVESSNNATNVINIQKGVNVFKWTVTENGCVNSSLVTINNNTPIIEAGPAQQTCFDNVVLAGNSLDVGETGVWTQISGVAATIVTPSLFNSGVEDLQKGTSVFKWTISNANCTVSDEIAVTYNKIEPEAGINLTTCDGSTNLMAVKPQYGEGTWTAFGTANFINNTIFNTNVSNLDPGPTTLRWTVKYAGCSEYDEMVVTNNEVYVNAGAPQTICEDNTHLFGNMPNPAGSGLWMQTGGLGHIVNPTLFNTEVTGLSSGINVFSWTITEGVCDKTQEVVITNNEVTDVNAGVDREICGNETRLGALDPSIGSGVWSISAGDGVFDNSLLYNTRVSGLVQGLNRLVWTVNIGACSASDTVRITSNSPTIAKTSANEEICTKTFTLVANNPAIGETGFWTNEYGAVGDIQTPSSSVTLVTNIGPGTNYFKWTIRNSLCSSEDEIIITNNGVSTDAGLDASLCSDTAVLSANNPAPETGYWSVINSGGNPMFDNSINYTTTVRGLASGANIFKWTVHKGICSAWDLVTIRNDITTTASAGDDKTVCNSKVILSGNNPSIGIGEWTLLGGEGNIEFNDHYNTLVTDLGAGDNTFRWTISQGNCSDFDDVTVTNDVIFVSAGINDAVCGSYYPELNGNLPGVGENGVWSVTGGSGVFASPSSHNSSISGLAQGDNTLTWTITGGGCSNEEHVVITNNTPPPANVSSNQQKCVDYTTIFASPEPTGRLRGLWTLESGSGTFVDETNFITNVTDLGPGQNQYRWTIYKGECFTSAIITVENNSVDAIVGDDISVCGSTAYLNGSQPRPDETGTWTRLSGNGQIVAPSVYNSVVENLNQGENKFRWTIRNSLCSDYEDIVIDNDLYTAHATIAGKDTICANHASLLGNIPIAGCTGLWNVQAGAGAITDNTNPTSEVVGLQRGNSTIRWTISKNGCENHYDINITNYMVEAYAGDDIYSCGANVTLVANELYDYEQGMWTLVSGVGTFEGDQSVNEVIVSGLGAGSNEFSWRVVRKDGFACEAEDNIVVYQNSFQTSAGLPQVICAQNATLQAQDPYPGRGVWSIVGSPGVTIENPTNYVTDVTGLQDFSENTFKWTVFKNNCTASADVLITNNFVHANAGYDDQICVNEYTLNAVTPIAGSGTWTIASGGADPIIDVSNVNAHVTGLLNGETTFVWTVIHKTCVSSDDVTITNNNLIASAGYDKAVCVPNVQLHGYQPQGDGQGLWEVVGGTGVITTRTLWNTTVTNLQRGTNTFRWTVFEDGCSNGGDEIIVTNNDFDTYAGPDQMLDAGVDQTFLNADDLEIGSTGVWSRLSGSGTIITALSSHTLVTDILTGVNVYQWTVTKNGCSDEDEVSVIRNFTPNAGKDTIICKDSLQLYAQSGGDDATQWWELIQGHGDFRNVTDPQTWVTNIGIGDNIYRWYVTANGYSAYDEIMVTNNSFTITAGEDIASCDNEIQLHGQIPSSNQTGLWSISGTGGGNIANPSIYNTTVSGLGSGDNRFVWTIQGEASQGGCKASDTVAIKWNVPPIAAFDVDPKTFCAGTDVTFINQSNIDSGKFVYIYNIQGEADTTSLVSTNVIHSFENTTNSAIDFDIRLIATDTATGCYSEVIETITAYPQPTVEFEPHSSPNYVDNPISFSHDDDYGNGANYMWNWGDGQTTFHSDYDGGITYHEFGNPGAYYVTLKIQRIFGDRMCENEVTHIVNIENKCPQVTGNFKYKGCSPLEVPFEHGVINAETFVWDFGDGSPLSYDDKPRHTFEGDPNNEIDKVYEVQVYFRNDATSCLDTVRTIEVTVKPAPKVNFEVSPDTVMSTRQLVHIFDYCVGDIETYAWDMGDGTTYSVSDFTHTYYKEGKFCISLTVETGDGCVGGPLEKCIFVRDTGFIKFPDAFSPNQLRRPDPHVSYPIRYIDANEMYPIYDYENDPHDNDIFHPVFRDISNQAYRLEIYNRWGEKIFESDNVGIGWDGYVNGVLAPQDVYVWKVSGTYRTGQSFRDKGSITLVR